MFSFLNKAARAAAAGTCYFNIRANAVTLIEAGNGTAADLAAPGEEDGEIDEEKVEKARIRLLEEIELGFANGLTKGEIYDACDHAATEHNNVTDNARSELDQVLIDAFLGRV